MAKDTKLDKAIADILELTMRIECLEAKIHDDRQQNEYQRTKEEKLSRALGKKK